MQLLKFVYKLSKFAWTSLPVGTNKSPQFPIVFALYTHLWLSTNIEISVINPSVISDHMGLQRLDRNRKQSRLEPTFACHSVSPLILHMPRRDLTTWQLLYMILMFISITSQFVRYISQIIIFLFQFAHYHLSSNPLVSRK